MDTPYRLKIKIGPYEFDAEGSAEIVQAQLQMFKDMIACADPLGSPYPQNPFQEPVAGSTMPANQGVENFLNKIMQGDDEGRIVSLTVRPETVEQAILLILLGQKVLLSHESVTGGVIMEGITATGGLQVTRVDRLLEKLGTDGDVIVLGQRRSKTYRLTNAGANKAKEIAAKQILLVS